MAKLAAALVVVVAVSAWAWTRHGRTVNERSLSAVATELAGRDVHVHCQGFFSELLDVQDRAGEVQFRDDGTPPDSTFLTRKTCRDLQRFRSRATHSELDCLPPSTGRRGTSTVTSTARARTGREPSRRR